MPFGGMVDVRRFFDSRLRRHGDSPAALDWSAEGQRQRFVVLAEPFDLRGLEVLDVGCGLGHLYDFLRARSREFKYVGVDLSPRMVARARELHRGVEFQVVDALTDPLPREADLVLASGVLNLEDGGNEASMRKLLRSCYAACRKAAAVNMLSAWADWFERGRHYYDPPRMLRAARRITRRAVLRHDYMPHDFTLYLYRESKP